MTKSPAFQFYADKFISGTAHFSAAQVGAYIRLLCFQWEHGAIPNSPAMQLRIAGCAKKELAEVLQKFSAVDNSLLNQRLEQERKKQEIWREKSAYGGKKSAENRATKSQPKVNHPSNLVEPPLQPNEQPNANISSSSSSSNNILYISAREQTCLFFGVSEQKHAQAYFNISNCLEIIEKENQLPYYLEQLTAYKQFKAATQQQVCNWNTWLLGEEKNVGNGHWCREDYKIKLKNIENAKLKTNNGGSGPATAAIASGRVKDFGKIEL
jgi:uncharacterized protein YdaU (DUF1376 family)